MEIKSNQDKKKKIVKFLIDQKVLVSDEIINALNDTTKVDLIFEKLQNPNPTIEGITQLLKKQEKEDKNNKQNPQNSTQNYQALFNPLHVVFNYEEIPKKREYQDFVSFFNARYNTFEKMLQQRQELRSLTSISRILHKKDKDTLSVIGIVSDKEITKNGNIMLTVEDPTGMIKVLVNKNKQDIFEEVKNIVLDEVIGIVGVNGENIIFANNVIWPDIPLTKEFKKAPQEQYAVFISDVHVGSTYFLEEELQNFIAWLQGKIGNEEQKRIASKVGYVFIIGDLVDGVGIYPGQDKELAITDLKVQYDKFAELFSQIPQHIKLIICPGNHDAMRLAEPQLEIYNEFSKPLWDLPNSTMVTNPAVITIGKTNDFPGLDVLIYHGYSFDYYNANVESLRKAGGSMNPAETMKFLLKRRHLAPTHTSTLYIPNINKDALVINHIPDVFATGHLHKSAVTTYRNINIIAGSCWQAKTAFQEKVGHHPDPCRVPILNLQTRQVKIMNFSKH